MGIHVCDYLEKDESEITRHVHAASAEKSRRDGNPFYIMVHDKVADGIGNWRLRLGHEEAHIKFCPWCGVALD